MKDRLWSLLGGRLQQPLVFSFPFSVAFRASRLLFLLSRRVFARGVRGLVEEQFPLHLPTHPSHQMPGVRPVRGHRGLPTLLQGPPFLTQIVFGLGWLVRWMLVLRMREPQGLRRNPRPQKVRLRQFVRLLHERVYETGRTSPYVHLNHPV